MKNKIIFIFLISVITISLIPNVSTAGYFSGIIRSISCYNGVITVTAERDNGEYFYFRSCENTDYYVYEHICRNWRRGDYIKIRLNRDDKIYHNRNAYIICDVSDIISHEPNYRNRGYRNYDYNYKHRYREDDNYRPRRHYRDDDRYDKFGRPPRYYDENRRRHR